MSFASPIKLTSLAMLALAGVFAPAHGASPTPVMGVPAESPLRQVAPTPAPLVTPPPAGPSPSTNAATATPPVTVTGSPNPTPPPLPGDAPAPPTTYDAAQMKAASAVFAKGQWELALKYVDSAIRYNPKNPDAYDLRASFYVSRKLWSRAIADYLAAQKIAPTSRTTYDIGEVYFMSRDYENARLKFSPLKSDPKFADLAAYKIFMCDLMGRHDQEASTDLSLIDANADTPAHFFGHAVWELYHGNRHDGSSWLHKASDEFGPQLFEFYMLSLSEAALVTPANMTFVTKDGTSYKGVRGFVEESGLRITDNRKWETIPFANLPTDLTVFPIDVQQDIQENQIANTGSFKPEHVTFTTKDGRSFIDAQITDEDDGLFVETGHGTTVIAYDQVPLQMPGFPPDLKARINARLLAKEQGHSIWTQVSLTTRDGQRYDQVRAMVNDSGLNLITSDGWVTVPFSDLPKDLTELPAPMRDQIAQKSTHHHEHITIFKTNDDYLHVRISFTTAKGKSYDDVKYAVSDEGVSVLTPEGWLVVPFSDLPADLSPFPVRARNLIESKKAEYLDHLQAQAAKAHGASP